MTRRLISIALSAGSGALAAAADYHVSSKGDDRVAGTKAAPWRTIARVNGAQLRPGDRVLFEGGQSFAGRIEIGAEDSGTEEAPAVLISYGAGQPRTRGGEAAIGLRRGRLARVPHVA